MADLKASDLQTFKEEVQSYYGWPEVTCRRDKRRGPLTQELLAWEMYTDAATLSRKLSGAQRVTGKDVQDIGAALVYLGRITRRTQLQHLFGHISYQLPEHERGQEPWNHLLDDTTPLRQPEQLPIQNASFENWKHDEPVKWLCNTKTGWVKPVPGRTVGSTALEIGGNRDNREWVYCRTRETQEIRVVTGSKISLSFWARKTQEGTHPERNKYVEAFFHDGFQWVWGFGQDVTNTGDYVQYQTEWWDVPTNVQRVSVGAVVYKDGAFQVDDVALWIRQDR